MSKVPITVAIPVGPHEANVRWLKECLHSVTQQTTKPNQILIIDDSFGSFKWHQAGVQIYRAPWKLGVAHAFNFGVGLARNELVFMLGSDDMLTPTCLERCYEAYIKNKERDAYYWVSLEYLHDHSIQALPCNAAMVTKEFWRQTGGFPVETACGQPDGTFISMMMVHRPDDLIPVARGFPLYQYRLHDDIDTIKHGAFWEATMHIRGVLTTRGFQ